MALGDSYTIGTAVAAPERWPDQLVAALAGGPAALDLVANLGVNGYTSQDVIDRELPRLAALQPELLSVLVGVNDVVRGVPLATYRQHLVTIVDDLVRRVGSARLFTLTTPDYTVTPAGADYGRPDLQAAAIRDANAILVDVASAHRVLVIDIHGLSLRAATEPALVARDGLHPSGEQYRLWVERIGPAVEALLRP